MPLVRNNAEVLINWYSYKNIVKKSKVLIPCQKLFFQQNATRLSNILSSPREVQLIKDVISWDVSPRSPPARKAAVSSVTWCKKFGTTREASTSWYWATMHRCLWRAAMTAQQGCGARCPIRPNASASWRDMMVSIHEKTSVDNPLRLPP